MLIMAFSAIGTSYGVAFLVLGILPSIEKLFDITTGMTLAELRDPKRPLLRQLQQRAPGTYNHSLQMANIAEAAAEAIGADSLLAYVGAMYHDIGKINKPDYFVENQSSGINKHDKLSPAMSLLVIIGHVKNGVELAREYGLPRPIIHFIESHHGTTLVEYFYHAARERAEMNDEGSAVAEIEYRYPGPKPRSKEAAILMLADAVESATRAIAEPTPSRIENLVRKLGQKRLEDGQFDECDLTFKELTLIEDAMINRLLSIHHSRISYPSTAMMADGVDSESESTQTAPVHTASA
jgi:cyclic-di-AMP phosphodiesterase PgpH